MPPRICIALQIFIFLPTDCYFSIHDSNITQKPPANIFEVVEVVRNYIGQPYVLQELSLGGVLFINLIVVVEVEEADYRRLVRANR